VTSVVDASTLLAVCQQEVGADVVRDKMRHGIISTVNLSEAYEKSLEYGKLAIAEAIVHAADLRIVAFNEAHARRAAELALLTKNMGVSFADRACMALGMAENLPVLTGNGQWLDLNVPLVIELFRPRPN